MFAAGRFFAYGAGLHVRGTVKGGLHAVFSRAFQHQGGRLAQGQILHLGLCFLFGHDKSPSMRLFTASGHRGREKYRRLLSFYVNPN
jgi:hypothetical protein